MESLFSDPDRQRIAEAIDEAEGNSLLLLAGRKTVLTPHSLAFDV